MMLAYTVVCTIFVTAGLLNIAEREQHLTFLNAVYLTCISLSTIGYGDIHPQVSALP
jgi:hypothetical protein